MNENGFLLKAKFQLWNVLADKCLTIFATLFLICTASCSSLIAESDKAKLVGSYLIISPEDSELTNTRLVFKADNTVVFLEANDGITRQLFRARFRIEGDSASKEIRIFIYDFESDVGSLNNFGEGLRVVLIDEILTMNVEGEDQESILRRIYPQERHVLTIENGTGNFALVRIKSLFGGTKAEMAIDAGSSKVCWLSDGNYYEVVRFGEAQSEYYYSKGESWMLTAAAGYYSNMHLTLHAVPTGTHKTYPASAEDFE